jgi:hypothetical protein
MCHPRAISSAGLPEGRRVASCALIADASGDFVKPSSAERNSSRSFALERSAPAPASVGKSQFLAIPPLGSCPATRRFRSGSESVMVVLFIFSGSRMRARTSSS